MTEQAVAPKGTNLGRMLKTYRLLEDQSTSELGARVGLSSSTWSRLEGGTMPDADTMLKLMTWMLAKAS